MKTNYTNVANDNELYECNDYQLLGSVLLVSFVEMVFPFGKGVA
jgi:hypothetical protein